MKTITTLGAPMYSAIPADIHERIVFMAATCGNCQHYDNGTCDVDGESVEANLVVAGCESFDALMPNYQRTVEEMIAEYEDTVYERYRNRDVD